MQFISAVVRLVELIAISAFLPIQDKVAVVKPDADSARLGLVFVLHGNGMMSAQEATEVFFCHVVFCSSPGESGVNKSA